VSNFKDFLKSYALLIAEQLAGEESLDKRKTPLSRRVFRRKDHSVGTVKRPDSFLGKSLYDVKKEK